MRHRVQSTRLNLKSAPLKAMVRALATSLVINGFIQTTEQKAKFVQPVVEKLMTIALQKEGREAIRSLKKVLFTEEASREMLGALKTRFAKRASGRTRIIPIGVRKGDAAPLVQLEFLEK